MADGKDDWRLVEVVLHVCARSRVLVVDEGLRSRRQDVLHTPLAALAAEVRTRRRVAADLCVHVAGNRNSEAEVAGAGSLEDVVAEGATVGARSRAVVRSPSHAANRDADLDHCARSVERVVFDDDILERTAPWVVVDRVDTAERTAGGSDDGVAGDDGAGCAKDDDTSISRVGDDVARDGRLLAGDGNSVRPLTVEGTRVRTGA